jgi:hypothetical protein
MTTTTAARPAKAGAAKKAAAKTAAASKKAAASPPASTSSSTSSSSSDTPPASGDHLPESGTVDVMIDGPKTLDELKDSPLASDPVTVDVKDSDAAKAGLVHTSSLERNTTELDNRITRVVGADPISLGSFGDHVTFLQAGLRTLGYHVQIDGSYGPQTQAAVERFRGEHTTKSDATTVTVSDLREIARRVIGG